MEPEIDSRVYWTVRPCKKLLLQYLSIHYRRSKLSYQRVYKLFLQMKNEPPLLQASIT